MPVSDSKPSPLEWDCVEDLLEAATDAIVGCDAQLVITSWNRGATQIYGWTREEALGEQFHRLLKTAFADGALDLEETLLQQGHWEGELRQQRRDGTALFVASRWTALAPGGSRLLINTDITAQKREQSALRDSERRYRRFVDEHLTGNFIGRADGQIVTCNQTFAQMFGFDSVEAAQQANLVSLFRNRKEGADLLDLIAHRASVERQDLEMRSRTGDAVYVVARFIGRFNEGGQISEMQGYLFNDTKRKLLEEQLIQAQKMEGLGTLAGGIAHDFNNILAIILGYAMRLEDLHGQPLQVAAAVKVIRESVERGAALVQQLLTSARQTEARFSSVDLNALLQKLEPMLRATFTKMIKFELRLHPNLPLVKADPTQIHQVLLNLCVNARDAMPKGGTLTLETGAAPGAEVAEFFMGAVCENYAFIRVRDTGAGMTPEVKPHVFEPFFTTKERSKGTGLGLSVVYGVIKNHRGFIQLETEPGAGTTFNIFLPLDSAPEQINGGSGEPSQQTAPVAQTILLVEDEEMLRELGITILEGEGYRVLAAKDGVEALEIFEDHRETIGLVVCDLGLPRLGGRDVFLRMKERKPGVRAIVASGYLEPAMRSEILKAGVIDTIQKPYDFREMLAKIRTVIGEAVPARDDHPRLF